MTEETIAKIRQAEKESDLMEQEAEAQVEKIEKETEQMIETLYAEAKKKDVDYAEKCRLNAEEKAREQEVALLKATEESFADVEKAGKEKLPGVAKVLLSHLMK